MKYFIIFFLLIWSSFGYGQKEFIIYNTFQDYTNNNYLIINDYLSILNANKSASDDNLKDIWGIAYEDKLYRIFDNKILKVEDTSGLIIYTRTFQQDHFQANPNWLLFNIDGSGIWLPINIYESETSKRKDYYFSISLQDKIFELSKREVINQVKNRDFEKALKKKIGWLTPISEFDDKNNSYLLNQVYLNIFNK